MIWEEVPVVKQSEHAREGLLLIVKLPKDKPGIYSLQITTLFPKAPLTYVLGEISCNFGEYIQSVMQVIWNDKMQLLWIRL